MIESYKEDNEEFQIERNEIISSSESSILSIHNMNNKKENNINFIKEGPINLITFTKEKFILNEKAIDFLNTIDVPIIVVSIVGKARTGKSYLMNLLLNNNNGFEVASTINSCTKGIWIWNKPRDQPNSDYKIIFIDSEGTNSVDLSTKTYDAKIFSLVVLLSSIFIYNTVGNIDEKSIGDLALAAHLSTTIVTDTNNNEEAIRELAPNFIWVLRDFSLDKVDPMTGEEISNDEYLEICLRNKITTNKNSNENNLIRKNIIKFFKQRNLITLCRPIDEEKNLQNLNKIPFENLKPSFKEDFLNLKQKIFYDSKPKCFQYKKITGKILAGLLVKFIECINSGIVPNINTAWDNIIENDIYTKYEQCIKIYDNKSKQVNKDINENYKYAYNIINNYKEILEENSEIKSNKQYYEIYQRAYDNLLKYIDKDLNRNYLSYQANIMKNIRLSSSKYSKIIDEKMYNDSYYIHDYSQLYEDYSKFIKIFINESEFSSNDTILDNFLKSDLNITKDLLYYINNSYKKKNQESLNEINKKIKLNEFDIENNKINFKYKENVKNINSSLDNKYAILSKDLIQKENELRRLIGKYTKLMETRDKYYIDDEIRLSKLRNIKYLKGAADSHHSSNQNVTKTLYRRRNGECSLILEEDEKQCKCNLSDFKCLIF